MYFLEETVRTTARFLVYLKGLKVSTRRASMGSVHYLAKILKHAKKQAHLDSFHF